jgi:hypothetical protein
MAIWYILWSFGNFSPFWYFVPRKIWQPWWVWHSNITATSSLGKCRAARNHHDDNDSHECVDFKQNKKGSGSSPAFTTTTLALQ